MGMADGTMSFDFTKTGQWEFMNYEVRVTRGDQSFGVPLSKTLMIVGSDPKCDVVLDDPAIGKQQGVLHCRDKQIVFTNGSQKLLPTINGTRTSFCEMNQGVVLEIGPFTLQMVQTEQYWASLEGFTAPNRGRRWTLRDDVETIGRAGTRKNSVELDDPTVSRTQATITREAEQTWLQNESSNVSSCCINGQGVSGKQALADGDLIQVGQQLLRFKVRDGKSL